MLFFILQGSILDKGYMPGPTTAIILYIPFYLIVIRTIVKDRRINISHIIAAAFLGAAPMLIHGYMIIPTKNWIAQIPIFYMLPTRIACTSGFRILYIVMWIPWLKRSL
jgi:hypothetical protein